MNIRVELEVDDVVCEATITDPHGNQETVRGVTVEDLIAGVAVELHSTINACQLAEEENRA